MTASLRGQLPASIDAYVAPMFWPFVLAMVGALWSLEAEKLLWKDGSEILRAVEELQASYATAHWFALSPT